LSKLNPTIEITPIYAEITEENVYSVIDRAQVVVDGLDRLNAACVKQKIP
jgi:molybdopterin/thiamine biosynthesis adenylyltransferase